MICVSGNISETNLEILFQTELMVIIYSKSLPKANGKVLRMRFGKNTNRNP